MSTSDYPESHFIIIIMFNIFFKFLLSILHFRHIAQVMYALKLKSFIYMWNYYICMMLLPVLTTWNNCCVHSAYTRGWLPDTCCNLLYQLLPNMWVTSTVLFSWQVCVQNQVKFKHHFLADSLKSMRFFHSKYLTCRTICNGQHILINRTLRRQTCWIQTNLRMVCASGED